MKQSGIKHEISQTIGQAYARKYIMMSSSAKPEEIIEIIENTIASMGITIREAVNHFGLTLDDDQQNKICDDAVDVFMSEVDMLNRSWSNRSHTPN